MRDRTPAYGPWLALAALVSVGAWHWARIETPQIPLLEMLALIAIAVAPTVVAQLFGRLAGLITLAVCLVAAIGMTSSLWPGDSGPHRYPAAVVIWINHGAHDWFNATTPFDYGRFRAVDSDARLLFMALVATLAWTVVLRRLTLISIALALVLFAFPSTVLNLEHSLVRAAWFLAAALITLRLVPRRPLSGGGSSQAWAVGTAVVVLGLIVSALPGVNKAAFMSWHTWDPLASSAPPRDLSYVWNQTYKPLHWRGKPTAVLNVWAAHPTYWKVATLETFSHGAWIESSYPITQGVASVHDGTAAVPPAALPLKATQDPGHHSMAVRVKVLALADSHLVSATQPLQWSGPADTPFTLNTDTTAEADHDLARNTTYSSLVYVSNPSRKALQDAGTAYPRLIQRDLSISGRVMDPWPQSPGADANAGIDPALIKAANQVWTRSQADTETNVWSAAFDVEAYFRAKPFVYDLDPKFSDKSPVLAQFMLTGYHGYCQMFSGAMALVLRLHGIPVRVPVGFTTGVKGPGVTDPYVITDRNAHSWVEVYFPGYGWQPFEPTPTRHLPDGASSSNARFLAALQKAGTAGPGSHLTPLPKAILKNGVATTGKVKPTVAGHKDSGGSAGKGTVTTSSGHSFGFITAAAALALAVIVLMALVKFGAVRWRYLRRGPRAQAAAAYRDLATFVGDQGIKDSPERTFEDLSGEIKNVFGVDASEFAANASRARYAPVREAEPAGRELRGELRAIKRRIRKQLSLRDRFTGALRLRSALAQITSLD